MRNLVAPSALKKRKKSTELHTHYCAGLQGLTAMYAFSSKGVLKIINRDVDPDATGHYEGGKFYLTTALTRAELLEALVKNYKPSFIPIWSKVLFDVKYIDKLEQLKNKHPEFYAKFLRSKISLQQWLDDKGYKANDIKSDVLIDLFHEVNKFENDSEVLDYVKTAGIPYTIKTKQGATFKKLWFSPLWNKSLGRFGKGSIFTSYLNALKDITKESWDAAIFGTPHKGVLDDYPIFQYDLKNWSGAREGKVDKKNYSLGLGITSGEKSLGTAADVLMLIESLTFFRGYLGEEFGQVDADGDEVSIKKKPRFSLIVRNTSSSFHTGLMSEMTLAHKKKNLIGVEEIFVPIWKDKLTFNQAKERLSMTAEMPVETFINTSKDLMSFLSQHAVQSGIDSYVRFACLGRGGKGMATLYFLIPVEEYFPRRSKRNDIVAPFVSLYNQLLYKINKENLPHSTKNAASNFIQSINGFSISRSTTREIMYSFLEFFDAVEINGDFELGGEPAKQYLQKFSLPSWWVNVLEKNHESSEMRIGKSIARERQLCYLEDISELVQGNLSSKLAETYARFIKFIEDDESEEITQDVKCWMPIDYLITYKFHSYKRLGMNSEKYAWRFFFENRDADGALSIALDALYSRELVKGYVQPFCSTEREDLILAMKIPLSTQNQRRVRSMLK